MYRVSSLHLQKWSLFLNIAPVRKSQESKYSNNFGILIGGIFFHLANHKDCNYVYCLYHLTRITVPKLGAQ